MIQTKRQRTDLFPNPCVFSALYNISRFKTSSVPLSTNSQYVLYTINTINAIKYPANEACNSGTGQVLSVSVSHSSCYIPFLCPIRSSVISHQKSELYGSLQTYPEGFEHASLARRPVKYVARWNTTVFEPLSIEATIFCYTASCGFYLKLAVPRPANSHFSCCFPKSCGVHCFTVPSSYTERTYRFNCTAAYSGIRLSADCAPPHHKPKPY